MNTSIINTVSIDSKGQDSIRRVCLNNPRAESIQSRVGLVILVFGLLCCSLFSPSSDAIEPGNEHEFFLPNDLNFFLASHSIQKTWGATSQYNDPYNDRSSSQWLVNFARGLDNDALFLTAENVRTDDMSAAQRFHNYQWIQQHYNESPRHLKTVLRKIIGSSIKAYLNLWRENQLAKESVLPDANGYGEIHLKQTQIDYKIKISNDYVKFVFKLDFN